MLENHWYAVMESKEIKKNKAIVVKRLGKRLAFWRKSDDTLGCIQDLCAHRGASIGRGEVVDGHIRCPFHGLEYDETGKCVLIPANGKAIPVPQNFRVNAYHVVEKHGFIWLWFGEKREKYPELPFIEDVDESFRCSTFVDHWKVHYSLCIENQLDVSHLPFVHRTTIGKGNKTLVDGPVVKGDDKGFGVWVFNKMDDGQQPKKASEIPVTPPPMLTVNMPSIWQNRITEDIRIVIAFVPVDEEHTLIYMRFCQRFLTLPGLGKLIAFLGKLFSIKILRQDKAVVETQLPKKSELKMGGQNLFQADYPIVFFRRIREKLKQS